MEDLYWTTDTALASFLITEGYKLTGIDYSNPRYRYNFEKSEEIQELADRYISGKALAEPSAFIRVNKKLLRIIYKKVQWEED